MHTPLTETEIAETDARFEAVEVVLMFCIHHGILCEALTEPLSNRIRYIKENKPRHEIETRLAALQPVKHVDLLPVEFVDACRTYDDAGRAYYEARRAYDGAWRACGDAVRAYGDVWRAYDDAVRACDEAGRAYDEAGRAHKPAILARLRAEYPETQWGEYGLVFTEAGEVTT